MESSNEMEQARDLIDRQTAIDAISEWGLIDGLSEGQAIEILGDEEKVPSVQPNLQPTCNQLATDYISRQAATDAVQGIGRLATLPDNDAVIRMSAVEYVLFNLPSAQPDIIRCRECKHWKQQTNYAGAPLSFGFCESDDMWRSLYGETYEVSHIDTDDDFYCGYAERRTDG